ncbi:hypothetical protein [Paenibacillus soyae]|uniref:Uncharacterized protein n=1 Tax=Paenibacillus soyae TaxID=2969249 RepID=A0A9X2MMG6_9BACL|nr:hypothetical protein [Paenibacillus soyae]MCR2803409.1 hypothetical protein [Paenibacillus soyae]
MDRQSGRVVEGILSKISSKDLVGAELLESKLIYNLIGFISACDGTDNAVLISNLGYLLSQKGLNTCIVDLKVFYPNLYHYVDCHAPKKASGLIKLLKSDKVDVREEIQATKYERLYLLSPSPQDLMEEYFDFEFEHLERVLATLKQMFDIVLIDIPNNPPLEFCLGAMKACHIGFFTATERTEAVIHMVKLLDFANSVGISTAKFTNVIMMNLQNIDFDFDVYKEMGLNIITALPYVKDGVARANKGKLYVKDNPLFNRQFMKEIQRLAAQLAEQ